MKQKAEWLLNYDHCDKAEPVVRLNAFGLRPESMEPKISQNKDAARFACQMSLRTTAKDSTTPILKQVTHYTNVASGANGSFLRGDRNLSSVSPFGVKVPEDSYPEGVHEAFIGMACLNPLREKIPNFCYTYSVEFSPSEASTIQSVNGRNILGTNGPLRVETVLETISGNTLKKCLSNLAFRNPETFTKIFLQVISALNVAYQHCHFTHYDLHDDNVLVEVLPRETNIPIYMGSIDEEPQYISTRYLARIIDYGFSFARYASEGSNTVRGEVVGYPHEYQFTKDLEKAFVFADKAYPANDISRLLLFCANEAQRHNDKDLLGLISDLYLPFHENGSLYSRLRWHLKENGNAADRRVLRWGDLFYPLTYMLPDYTYQQYLTGLVGTPEFFYGGRIVRRCIGAQATSASLFCKSPYCHTAEQFVGYYDTVPVEDLNFQAFFEQMYAIREQKPDMYHEIARSLTFGSKVYDLVKQHIHNMPRDIERLNRRIDRMLEPSARADVKGLIKGVHYMVPETRFMAAFNLVTREFTVPDDHANLGPVLDAIQKSIGAYLTKYNEAVNQVHVIIDTTPGLPDRTRIYKELIPFAIFP